MKMMLSYAKRFTLSSISRTIYPRLLYSLPDKYDSTSRDKFWYQWWIKKNLFQDKETESKESFTMLLPPPNVTGKLHVGHALTVAIQDSLVRWHRMKGERTQWIPGVDHAGIATQSVVERDLMKEGKNLHQMTRQDTVEAITKWKDKHRSIILEQLSHLGGSLDWSQLIFTLDNNHSEAVTEAFVQLYEKELIYRDLRFVNWSCHLKTALSDIEVDHDIVERSTKIAVPGLGESVTVGEMHTFHYPVADGQCSIPVATTRIETMLGDVAVAVHPDDDRYKNLHGKFVINPFNHRRLPIICDRELVDINKGTGAVKITPAHDPIDYACSQRHNLPIIEILNEDGTMNDKCGCENFIAQHRFKVRNKIISELKEKGLYAECISYPSTIFRCSRSGDIIEPMLKPQWYIKCDTMSTRALNFVRDGLLNIVPRNYVNEWNRWLEDSRDWCISRQLCWGHEIPAWRLTVPDLEISDQQSWFIARSEREAYTKAKEFLQEKGYNSKFTLEKDIDVLDTWFSSALLPLSADGWPNNKRMNKYPLSVMETGADILYFWVARMVMLCSELTDGNDSPFPTVYLHPIVRDSRGRKMSKSLGNAIDPLHVINGVSLNTLQSALDKSSLPPSEIRTSKQQLSQAFPQGIAPCGADALRLTLLLYMKQGSGINLNINQLISNRNFCNKLWNAAKFASRLWGDDFRPQELKSNSKYLSQLDLWMLSRLTVATEACTHGLQNFKMDLYAESLIRLVRNELCDVYIEFMKYSIIRDSSSESSYWSKCVLYHILSNILRLAHPAIPHITEELWHFLPNACNISESITLAPFPDVKNFNFTRNDIAEKNVYLALNVLKTGRYIRNEYELPWSIPFRIILSDFTDSSVQSILQEHIDTITKLLKISSIEFIDDLRDKETYICHSIDESCSMYADIKSIVDFNRLIHRLNEQLKPVEKKIEKLQRKISDLKYQNYAPQELQEKEKAALADLINSAKDTRSTLTQLKALKLR